MVDYQYLEYSRKQRKIRFSENLNYRGFKVLGIRVSGSKMASVLFQ